MSAATGTPSRYSTRLFVSAGTLGPGTTSPTRFSGSAPQTDTNVSEDAARELRQRCADQDRELPDFLREFVDRYEGPYRAVQLPLPIC